MPAAAYLPWRRTTKLRKPSKQAGPLTRIQPKTETEIPPPPAKPYKPEPRCTPRPPPPFPGCDSTEPGSPEQVLGKAFGALLCFSCASGVQGFGSGLGVKGTLCSV